ncbi:MAG TPA: M3 family metallopeptidase, partial [Longimicrobiales bacterium]|nr:M3 family metallopeptidase [Longimicrobiales bacterium]
EWTGPYGGVPPFDQVRPDLFPGAFDAAIRERRSEVFAVASDPAPATFENTILPMQRWGRPLARVSTLFGVMTHNMSSPEYRALDREWSPRLAAARDEIIFNEQLFARIEAVYRSRHGASLTPEQLRLVERTYDDFVRAGARLSKGGKERLGEINRRLAALYADFAARVLSDEEEAALVIDDEADLAGLPPEQVAAAKAAAEVRGLEGRWVIVNARSSVEPFLQASTRRDLRERVWRRFKSRGDNGDANDTKALIAEIVRLRAERARLLGYPTHAHWRLVDSMAGDPAKARALLDRVWPAALATAREEIAAMQAVADAEGGGFTIEPWDYLHYAEKVRRARYAVDEAAIRAYFALENVIEAAFWVAGRLFGLRFTEITGQVPVFHPEVRVWEVRDAVDDAHRGLFYMDNFARAGKQSGAWASAYRIHETVDGVRTPIASNNNNFIRSAPGEPTLISLDDARTLFHEFGHALHTLLSEVRYPGLHSTPRDFVELPSQLYEHWLLTRPVLDRFARHYQTGEPIPDALVEKVKAAETFNQGYATIEYLGPAILDLELHTLPDGEVDPTRFEHEVLERIGMPREIAPRHRITHFGHLFNGDWYSAGYYSYLWADTMVADAWLAFEEAGDPFDAGTADRLRRYILAPGNSTDRAEAYRQFRGRDPEVEALLRQRGFLTKPPEPGN